MPSRANIHLSVVIPAFNEEERLPQTLRHAMRYLAAQPYRSEIVVVSDGSVDRTEQIVCQWPDSAIPLRLITHPDRRNHGKGAAVRSGMLAAQGDYRLVMDADNSTTVDQVARFWPCFDEGCDIGIGSRNAKGARVEVHQALYKELAGKFGNLIIRALAVPGVSDTQAGFKLFRRESAEVVFPRLTIERWGYDIEVLVIARLHKCRMREIPITWINSPGSKVTMKSYFQVLAEVGKIRRNVRAGIYS
jgi:dolichyl-phosphate beta-glucosyltransferase